MKSLVISISLFVLVSSALSAQSPEPPPVTATDILEHPRVITEPQWRTDVLIGAPMGIRFQRSLFTTKLWLEVGGGLYLIWPNLNVGLRAEGRLFDYGRSAWSVRPGITTAYNFGYDVENSSRSLFNGHVRDFGYTALDCDFSWRCRWTDRLHGELGLKLGIGIGYGLIRDGEEAILRTNVVPVPIAAITIGLNY